MPMQLCRSWPIECAIEKALHGEEDVILYAKVVVSHIFGLYHRSLILVVVPTLVLSNQVPSMLNANHLVTLSMDH